MNSFDKIYQENMLQEEAEKSTKKAGMQKALLNFAETKVTNESHQNIVVLDEDDQEEKDQFDVSSEIPAARPRQRRVNRTSTKPVSGNTEAAMNKYLLTNKSVNSNTKPKSIQRSVTKPAPGTVKNLKSMFEQ